MKRRINKNARKKNRNRSTQHRAKSQAKRPTTARQYFSKSRTFQETWDSVAHVVSKMRADGTSLRKAAREFGIDPGQVTRLARSALRKQKNGRYVARKTDRLLRVLSVLSAEGKREIALRDSRQSSLLGRYWDAVQHYLQTGDHSALKRFQGKKIKDANGKRHLLLTDLDQLNRLGSAGVLSFESLYGKAV